MVMCVPWGRLQAKVKMRANVTCFGGFVCLFFVCFIYIQTKESGGDMERVL